MKEHARTACMIGAIVFLVLLGWAVLSRVVGHEAGHGWQYDADCCSQQDCAPVIKAEISSYSTASALVPAPMTVTTIHGTAEVTSTAKRRESKDHRMHACIFMGKVICIYLPPGS